MTPPRSRRALGRGEPAAKAVTPAQLRAIRAGRLTRTQSCARKHGFSEERAARLAAKRRAETGEPIYSYPCLFCDRWHIGHVRHMQKRRRP